ncbi:MAG: hypothetical protein AAF602_30535, partial [Myxococcota bacterium]
TEATVSKVRESRERLGDAGILSLDHAATLLPLPNALAKAWLFDQGLVIELAGRQTVDWGEVREARRANRDRLAAPARSGFRRERL